MKAQRTKRAPVYDKPGAVSFTVRASNGKSGVYLIYPKGGRKPIYIGRSGVNLYKTITRHFQSWADKTQARVTYPQGAGYQIRIVYTSPQRAEKLERALILTKRPKDNPNKLEMFEATESEKKAATWLDKAPESEDLPF